MGFNVSDRVVNVIDAAILAGNSQGTPLTMGTTGLLTGALAEGAYDVWSDVDCYISITGGSTVPTTATGYLLRSGTTISVAIPASMKLGGVVATGTGTLSYHKVS